jgi:hypothetical protein
MADICTIAEVKSLAFDKPITDTRFKTGLINAIQVKYILPLLGETFYNDVIANAGNYTALLPFLKPVVAYYVKFHMLPDLSTDVSDTGTNKVPGNNRTAVEDIGGVRQSALDMAQLHVSALTKHLKDNTYPLYFASSNPDNKISIAGGVIIRNNTYDIDDFYLNNND